MNDLPAASEEVRVESAFCSAKCVDWQQASRSTFVLHESENYYVIPGDIPVEVARQQWVCRWCKEPILMSQGGVA